MSTDIAPPPVDYDRKGRELIEEGFCVLRGMLDAGTLRHTRDVAMGAVGELTEEQLEATRSPGTLINSYDHPGWRSVSATRGRWRRWSRWGSAAAGSGRR